MAEPSCVSRNFAWHETLATVERVPAAQIQSPARADHRADHEKCDCRPEGLRERKKLATRRALGIAAMRLAVERGLDNVLVEDIADAAGVSARTFNNYFGSKYEAICALQQDRALRIGEALRGRPAGEPLWESVTQAVLSQFGPVSHTPDKEWMERV